MDEQAVRAAVDRILTEAHGYYVGTGGECRMVPVSAIAELVQAVAAEPPDGTPSAGSLPVRAGMLCRRRSV